MSWASGERRGPHCRCRVKKPEPGRESRCLLGRGRGVRQPAQAPQQADRDGGRLTPTPAASGPQSDRPAPRQTGDGPHRVCATATRDCESQGLAAVPPSLVGRSIAGLLAEIASGEPAARSAGRRRPRVSSRGPLGDDRGVLKMGARLWAPRSTAAAGATLVVRVGHLFDQSSAPRFCSRCLRAPSALSQCTYIPEGQRWLQEP
jgi:hypothetical protein